MSTSTWPELVGEHPTLPELVVELVDAAPERRTPRGKVISAARPAFARVRWTPAPINLSTSNPDRLRACADQLREAADLLEQRHAQIVGV